MPTAATLCFIIRRGEVLLLLKTEGRFGGGKWNGLGGKLLDGESPLECVRREVLEESGLEIADPKPHGTLAFGFGDDPEKDWLVYVYSTTSFRGDPKPSAEGILRWFAFGDIPYHQMWADDRHWLPWLLRGESFKGDFMFDAEGESLLGFDIQKA